MVSDVSLPHCVSQYLNHQQMLTRGLLYKFIIYEICKQYEQYIRLKKKRKERKISSPIYYNTSQSGKVLRDETTVKSNLWLTSRKSRSLRNSLTALIIIERVLNIFLTSWFSIRSRYLCRYRVSCTRSPNKTHNSFIAAIHFLVSSW